MTEPFLFVSYRRDDTKYSVGRVVDHLLDAFGEGTVFHDVGSIPAGLPFREVLGTKLANCEAGIVAIGPSWASAEDRNGVRIYGEDDTVRFEVQTLLSRSIPVIPLLLQDAELPRRDEVPDEIRPLLGCHSIRINWDPHFRDDVQELVEQIKDLLGRDEVEGHHTVGEVRTDLGKRRYLAKRSGMKLEAIDFLLGRFDSESPMEAFRGPRSRFDLVEQLDENVASVRGHRDWEQFLANRHGVPTAFIGFVLESAHGGTKVRNLSRDRVFDEFKNLLRSKSVSEARENLAWYGQVLTGMLGMTRDDLFARLNEQHGRSRLWTIFSREFKLARRGSS